MIKISKNRFIALVLILMFIMGIGFVNMVNAEKYINYNPTGFTDTGSKWTSETNMYDDNIGTDGFARPIDIVRQNYIQLNRATTQKLQGFRFHVESDNGADSDVIVEYNDNGWIEIFNGTMSANTWIYVNLTSVDCFYTGGAVRVCLNSTGGTRSFKINEVDYIIYDNTKDCDILEHLSNIPQGIDNFSGMHTSMNVAVRDTDVLDSLKVELWSNHSGTWAMHTYQEIGDNIGYFNYTDNEHNGIFNRFNRTIWYSINITDNDTICSMQDWDNTTFSIYIENFPLELNNTTYVYPYGNYTSTGTDYYYTNPVGEYPVPWHWEECWEVISPIYNVTGLDFRNETLVRLINATNNYSWNEAVDNDVVYNETWKWITTISPNRWTITDTWNGNEGYWVYLYEDDYTINFIESPILFNESEHLQIAGLSLETETIIFIIWLLLAIYILEGKNNVLTTLLTLVLMVYVSLGMFTDYTAFKDGLFIIPSVALSGIALGDLFLKIRKGK